MRFRPVLSAPAPPPGAAGVAMAAGAGNRADVRPDRRSDRPGRHRDRRG